MARNLADIQKEMNTVDKQISKIKVDLNRWITRKSEIELEVAEIKEIQFIEMMKANEERAKQAAEDAKKKEAEGKKEEKK